MKSRIFGSSLKQDDFGKHKERGAQTVLITSGENLKEITNEYGHLVGLIMKMDNASESALAILASVELERILHRILETYLLPKSAENINDLLSSNGSCGTFFAQIELAYRLGIIPKEITHDLHIVRDMRNCFAHGVHEMSFESDQVKNKLFKLAKSQEKDVQGSGLSELRKLFQDSVYDLIDSLKTISQSVQKKGQK